MLAVMVAWTSTLTVPSPLPDQPVTPPRVKAPIVPPRHPPTPPGDTPVSPATAAAPYAATTDSTRTSPVAFPHPLISEVLYAVPAGEKGDANRDGSRHAAGDEFVELVNPHNKSIKLNGYTITDRNPPTKGQLKFTFPAIELRPGAVVVVFNGCDQGWGKAEQGARIVGDARHPPKAANPNFFGGYVFTAKNTSSRTSWNNSGDYVLLSDPAGNPIQCVHWGSFDEPLPAATVVEEAPSVSKSSVQRVSVTGPFTAHSDLEAPNPSESGESEGEPAPESANKPVQALKLAKGRLFSPGWFGPVEHLAAARDEKPGPAARDK